MMHQLNSTQLLSWSRTSWQDALHALIYLENVLHKMVEIKLLSERRNSHLLKSMYKRKESPQYIKMLKA